jgi:DMSO/TMAO reductase YedYZ molybdopterin-dependent catalytic subunit
VNALPAGQHEVREMPRFGLLPFAKRFPTQTERIELRVQGAGSNGTMGLDAGPLLAALPRVEQTSDLHCVTTWSKRGLRWSGVRFADFYREIALAHAGVTERERFVVLRAQDRAHTSLLLEDLMAPDVLLADRLDGRPLPIAHGAPLRLVAPAHYGYKSIKHLSRIEFRRSGADYRPVGYRFMQHPRGRVALEERGRWVPNWLLRRLYRPFIGPTTARFERALQDHLDDAAQETSA